MEVTVERPAPCVAKISLSVPFEEFSSEKQKLLVNAGRQLRVKGFRPGHVPPQVVEKLYGKEVEQETKKSFIQRAFERAMEEHKFKPLTNPNLELGEAAVLAGVGYRHDFTINLRPEFTLGKYKGLELDGEQRPVSDEEIEAAIEQVAKNNARPEPAGDDGLAEDGMAVARVEFLWNDQQLFMREGLRLSPSSPIVGVEPEASKKALTGVKDGATIELPATFPQDVEPAEARGQTGLCRITVGQVFKVLVPTRAELVTALKLTDEASLVARVREKLEEAAVDMEQKRIEQALVERIIDAHKMELPAPMVEDSFKHRVETLRRDLAAQGTPEADVEQQIDAQSGSLRTQSERMSRGYFLIEKIAEQESLKVTDEEVVKELRGIAERNRTSFDDVHKYYREKNLMSQLVMEIVERKVRTFLREQAVIKQES
ncbi:MAG: trigger factor [Planctomycetes bacterium]|nr:trigger factor [Planctomycetota bacterium]